MIEVQLVDAEDNPNGSMEKLEAHEKGALHRALSVLIINSKKEILLQRRALGKYHSPGLWTNTCCSHPYPGEDPNEAAKRRLQEEMGMSSELTFLFKFQYKCDFENGLIEHELDHVFIGKTDDTPHLNTDEAMAFKWMSIENLEQDMLSYPENYTFWFKLIIEKYRNEFTSYF
ncbi:isopentenyl-diphosphate Delta-isomerase [Crocinitomicaceae bacterium]|jgi:isopentenyl-diphosphate delta-isomerase|nr:isopentenyl-diphosphate Delta-isomerase [Crocinitomicaceae bacterium]MDB4649575.1 isopentenyl-diphosphate Delta-isomerase [Crocinitomicaceae bacterium]